MTTLATEVEQIHLKISNYLSANKRVFATSSFQSQSIALLHILSLFETKIPIYYMNTGYLFPETIDFAEQLRREFKLEIIGLRSSVSKSRQLDENGRLLFASDPDHCCFLNKVQPLEPLLMQSDVWVNGIRADQSEIRKQMKIEQPAPHNCLRYHPMLHWTSKMIYDYSTKHNLPSHPLEDQGYLSIGCEPCTTKFFDEGNERNSRWFGMNKTECGLHTQLVEKDS